MWKKTVFVKIVDFYNFVERDTFSIFMNLFNFSDQRLKKDSRTKHLHPPHFYLSCSIQTIMYSRQSKNRTKTCSQLRTQLRTNNPSLTSFILTISIRTATKNSVVVWIRIDENRTPEFFLECAVLLFETQYSAKV